MSPLSAERLRTLVSYDPKTGHFAWKAKRPKCHPGDRAGSPTSDGYWCVRVDGLRYRAHRLAWFWMTGVWPVGDVDHRDTNRMNNRWRNLREATRSQNLANSRLRVDNTSGYKGVCWDSRRQKWMAKISVGGVTKNIGHFKTAKAAHVAYFSEATKIHQQFARA